MKKGLILFALCCTSIYNYAQTVAFSDDFENGLSNWTIYIEDSYTVDPSVAEFAPGWIIVYDEPGDSAVGATSYFTEAGTADRWLVSPAINVGAFGNTLSWAAKSFDPSYPDGYRVLISNTTNDLSAFTDTVSLILQEYADWTTRSTNLSDSGYINQTIYVAFAINSYDEFKLYLDDIKVISEDPAGLTEKTKIDWALSPNPASSVIHITSKDQLKDYRIISLTGEIIQKGSLESNSINVSGINSGAYFLEIRDANSVVDRKRFIKQ